MMNEAMLWQGRFSHPPHAEMLRLTASVGIDVRLLDADLRATRAHIRALTVAGLLDEVQAEALIETCEALALDGALTVSEVDEDVHSLVERALTERLGELGARIHAGRSRNDLVACDLRLWAKEAAHELAHKAAELAGALADRAEEHAHTLLPGYTHLQPAQPITLGFHLVAHGLALARDAGRFADAGEAADRSPLGAGALAGTTLPLDPAVAARELGFAAIFDNAMDAVSDRDFACELVFAGALCAVHLSRLAEEIVLWTSAEFGFAALPDQWSTGSSMMPQKRNPDLAELIRGRAAGGISDLAGLLALLKGVPLAYVRDLQEDKGFVFAAVDRTSGSLDGMSHLVRALRFDRGRMEEAARRGSTWATALAEALVARGAAFRDAHAAVGRLVAQLETAGAGLEGATEADLRSAHPLLRAEDRALADPRAGVESRSSHGGTAPAEVIRQVRRLRAYADRYRGARQ